MLRNSYPCSTSHTLSFLLTTHRTSPSTSSSPLRTYLGTNPHSSPTPRSLRWNSIPFLDTSSHFTLFVLIRFTLPPDLRPAGLHFISRMLSFFSFHSCYAASVLRSISPFYIIQFSHLLSHWFSVVVAYPEPYLELCFSLRSVLYKVTRPLVCSLASSTQSSLVSSLPRFALRPLSQRSLPLHGTALLGRCDSS